MHIATLMLACLLEKKEKNYLISLSLFFV